MLLLVYKIQIHFGLNRSFLKLFYANLVLAVLLCAEGAGDPPGPPPSPQGCGPTGLSL